MNIDRIREEIIGNQKSIDTPYGKKLITYGDFTASGRSLKCVEGYMMKISETYANTHTEDCFMGRQTTVLYHDAKERIRTFVGATEDYAVLSVGSGTTGAIQRLTQILGIYEAPATRQIYGANTQQLNPMRPVVFVGPYEHHSNELIWKEANAEVIEIGLDEEGYFSLVDLENRLNRYQKTGRRLIGAFSAASNVTGVISPIKKITELMHRYGGIVFFDFAASGPYVNIQMVQDDDIYYDGVYLSPHKFVGGPGSSGLLIFKRDLYNNEVGPTCAGGGTVEYVSSSDYDFVSDIERREDAGTPAILQTLRTAIALEIKNAVSVPVIEAIEDAYIEEAIERVLKNPKIEMIGPKTTKNRLGILSFSIKYKDHYLHPRYVTTLLNDLFGIQSRAGCSCAGPYGHLLLGIATEKSDRYRQVIKAGCEAMKPGWVRVNFHYLLEKYMFEYLLYAIEFIAEYGYLFLKDYQVDSKTGNWINQLEYDEVLQRLNIDSILSSGDFCPEKYHKEDTQKQYEFMKQEAERLRDSYLNQCQEDRIELYEAENMKDLAWFYIYKR